MRRSLLRLILPLAVALAAACSSHSRGLPTVGAFRVRPDPPHVPRDVEPTLINVQAVTTALMDARATRYVTPPAVVTAIVWVRVAGAEGVPLEVRLTESSGVSALDRAAVEAATIMRFKPAELNGEPVSIWLRQPVSFSVERR